MDPAGNILELNGIDKRFGGVHALDDINLKIQRGEVHAIVGENGAGKSTLMKILAGTYQPDKGQIFLEGQEIFFGNPHEAHDAGINIIYQEFFAFPSLDVIANVFAGREFSRKFFLDEKEMRKRACEVFSRMGVNINVDAMVCDLSVADQQIIEIAKALVYQGKIVIMDEPNSALTDKETQALFEIIKRLKDQGITILYISHRLEEVFQISDRITVLRDGQCMGTWATNEVNIPFVISKMIGRDLEEAFPEISVIDKETPPILEVRNLCREDRLFNLNFNVQPGEILGFAGLEGSGIRELFHILFGLDKKEEGKITYNGIPREIGFSKDAIRLGWGMIPANRRDHGLIMDWSIQQNVSLVILNQLTNLFKLINDRKAEKIAKNYIEKLNVSTDSLDKVVFELSGGNQQKVVVAKWLATNPKILILDDPTRGIDVGAKSEIYHLIQNLSKEGLAILFTSSEIDEVLGVSHRIMVMRGGKIIKEFTHKEASKSKVLQFVSGDISEEFGEESLEQECV